MFALSLSLRNRKQQMEGWRTGENGSVWEPSKWQPHNYPWFRCLCWAPVWLNTVTRVICELQVAFGRTYASDRCLLPCCFKLGVEGKRCQTHILWLEPILISSVVWSIQLIPKFKLQWVESTGPAGNEPTGSQPSLTHSQKLSVDHLPKWRTNILSGRISPVKQKHCCLFSTSSFKKSHFVPADIS